MNRSLWKVLSCAFLTFIFIYTYMSVSAISSMRLQRILTSSTSKTTELGRDRRGTGQLHLDEILRSEYKLYPFANNTDFPQHDDILYQPKLKISRNETMLIFVVSAFGNHKRRDCIRGTWGSNVQRAGIQTSVLFVVGVKNKTSDAAVHNISDEVRTHNDILIVKVLDTYETIVYKEQAAMAWVLNNTRKNVVTNVLKTDDDSLVNMPGWLNLLEKEGLNGRERYIIGSRCKPNPKVTKFKGRNLAVEYPFRFFPTYCIGEGFIMSRAALTAIVDEMYYVKPFWVEDVYFSGILAKRTNTKIYTPSSYRKDEPSNKDTLEQIYSPVLEKPLIVHHMSSSFEQWNHLWKYYETYYGNQTSSRNGIPIKLV